MSEEIIFGTVEPSPPRFEEERRKLTEERDKERESQIAARESALAKLAKLGLTEEEAKAVIGF